MFSTITGVLACNRSVPDIGVSHAVPLVLSNDWNVAVSKQLVTFPINLGNNFNVATSYRTTAFPINLGNNFNVVFSVNVNTFPINLGNSYNIINGTGIKNVIIEPIKEYFTSTIYPVITEERLTVNELNIHRINLLKESKETLTVNAAELSSTGVLTETIRYIEHTNLFSSSDLETLTVNAAELSSTGQLTETIRYIDYTNPSLETLTVNAAELLTGTLT